MGKEWLYWGTSRSNKKGRRSEKGETINSEQVTPPAGCNMCAVFQIFDSIPYFQLGALNQQSPPSLSKQVQEPVILKGIEAPRNSLDLEEEPAHVEKKSSVSSSLMSSSAMKVDEENLNIPVGIQIRTSIDSRSPRVSTSTSRGKTDDFSSDCGSSPGIKTPTLVARLMGLDLLPENNSPLSSSSTFNTTPPPISHKSQQSHFRSKNQLAITGTLSLPETPRGSSDSRRSDVDNHRLSLQVNKQNIGEESEFSAYNAKKMARRRRDDQLRHGDENRSPSYYARQIVKQVKDRVSRKAGLDITNTIRSKDDQVGKYNQVVLLKPTKQSKVPTSLGDDITSQISKQSTPSCSPRLRYLETKTKPVITSISNKTQTLHSPRLSPLSPSPDDHSLPTKIITKPKSNDLSEEKQNQQLHQRTIRKGKEPIKRGSIPSPQAFFNPDSSRPLVNSKEITTRPSYSLVAGEKCNSHLKRPRKASDPIRSKKEEQFIHSAATNKANITDKKKCKRTTLSNQLLNSNVPTFFSLKKEPSPPPTKLLIKQESDSHPSKRSTQLSCYSSQSYKHTLNTIQESNSQDRCNGSATTTSSDGEEFQYIQRILKRAGIDKSTPVSLAKWYSKSHPLDPSIFHHFELFHYSFFTNTRSSTVSQRCNRKLIFQLVDELLVEILEPYINFNPWLIIPKTRHLHCQMHGLELIQTLYTTIQRFPSANCQDLEDIDALIDKDLQKTEVGISGAFEEGESIVLEIERNIFDSLLHESVTVFEMSRVYSITR